MKKIAVMFAALAALVSVPNARADAQSEVVIAAAGFAAKESCSCRFVVGQSESYCRDFGLPPGGQLYPVYKFDDTAKTVTATVTAPNATSVRVARLTAKNGCLLDRP